jgi:hypothetical protein
MTNTQTSRPSSAWLLIQNVWVRFGQESCSRPRVPTPMMSTTAIQWNAMAVNP